MFLEALAASVVGGVLCLDRAAGHIMISRPVVAGVVIGLVLGNPYSGLITGAMVELLWIDRSPIGTSIPPNDSLAAVIISASTVLAGRSMDVQSPELMVLAVLFFLPLGILGKKMETFLMEANDKLARSALEAAGQGTLSGIPQKHFYGLARFFIFHVLLLLLSILLAAQILLWIFPAVPRSLILPLKYIYGFLPLLGIAVALNTINLRGTVPVFCGVFLAMTVIMDLFF